MIRDRDPFGRALETLRERLRAGEFAQGAALRIVDLARDLNLSPTPIREALARLAGEGLVEERRGRGYFNWRLDVIDLVELYDLHGVYVAAAIEAIAERGQALPAPSDGAAMTDVSALAEPSASAVFHRIVTAAGSRALMLAQALLADRLACVSKPEAFVFPGAREEISDISDHFHHRRWPELARASACYHRRRAAAATEIVTVLRRQSPLRTI